jgi:hypothetical protein
LRRVAAGWRAPAAAVESPARGAGRRRRQTECADRSRSIATRWRLTCPATRPGRSAACDHAAAESTERRPGEARQEVLSPPGLLPLSLSTAVAGRPATRRAWTNRESLTLDHSPGLARWRSGRRIHRSGVADSQRSPPFYPDVWAVRTAVLLWHRSG